MPYEKAESGRTSLETAMENMGMELKAAPPVRRYET